MRVLRTQNKYRRYIYSPAVFFLLLAVAVFLAKSAWSVFQKQRISALEAKRAAEELAEFEAKKDSLIAEVVRLKTDAGVEEEIRDKFNVAKPGENTIIIVSSSNEISATSNKQSFFNRIWSNILGWFGE